MELHYPRNKLHSVFPNAQIDSKASEERTESVRLYCVVENIVITHRSVISHNQLKARISVLFTSSSVFFTFIQLFGHLEKLRKKSHHRMHSVVITLEPSNLIGLLDSNQIRSIVELGCICFLRSNQEQVLETFGCYTDEQQIIIWFAFTHK